MNKILWVYENAPIFCIIGNEKFPIMQKNAPRGCTLCSIIVSGIKDSQFYMDLIQ